MSDTNRRDRYSSSVVIAVLVAIVAIAWITHKPIENAPAAPQQAEIEQYENQDIGRLVAAIREFDPWHDTFAQWAMAFFTIAATLVSLRAIYLLRDTLDANRRAAEAGARANEIMQEDGRPWVDFSVRANGDWNDMGRDGIDISFAIKVENVGKRPALDVVIKYKCTRASLSNAYVSLVPGFVDEVFGEEAHLGRGNVYFPDQIGTHEVHLMQKFLGRLPPLGEDDGAFIVVCITYRDGIRTTYFHHAEVYQPTRTDDPEHIHGWELLRIGQAQSIN